MSALLPVPPLEASVSRLVPGSAVRALTLPMEDLREVPDLTQVLGGSSDRAWQVGDLLGTLATWYLCRSDEARRMEKERDSALSALGGAQIELANVRQSSSQQAVDLERALFDRERYRRERDALRVARAAPNVDNRGRAELQGAPRRPGLRDPFAQLRFDARPSYDASSSADASRGAAAYPSVAMPSLAELDSRVPPYPSYCPAGNRDPGSTDRAGDEPR